MRDFRKSLVGYRTRTQHQHNHLLLISHQQLQWRAEKIDLQLALKHTVMPANLYASWLMQYTSMQQRLSAYVLKAGHVTTEKTSCISHAASAPESQGTDGRDQIPMPIP